MAQQRHVKSNDSVDKMKIYGGIGLAGLATGAAIAVSNDPLYDDEKRARGLEVKRKTPWKSEYTHMNLDPLDAEMYDLHMQQGNRRHAERLESEARRNFHAKPWEHQQELVKAWKQPTPEIKGSLRAKMLMGARKLVNKL